MIYLFANEGYGLPFLHAAGTFLQQHRVPIRVVFSGDRVRLRDRPRQLLWTALRRRDYARRLRLPVRVVTDVNAPALGRRIRPADHGIIAGFNQIFRPSTIARFGSLVNFHPSILPFYRGPVPSFWCIRNHEVATGFTLHRVSARIDEGEILYQLQVPIESAPDAAELDRRIAVAAVPIFHAYVTHLLTGAEWQTVSVDARQIYRTHVGYASFPPVPSAS